MKTEKLISFFKNNLGKIVGGLLGFLLSILIIKVGILKTIFILILITLGTFIGAKVEKKEDFIEVLREIFSVNKI